MDTGGGAYQAVIALKRQLKFITFDGKMIGQKRGLFGGTTMADQTSVAFFEDGNKCISGSPKGNLYIWMGNKASKCI